jgi:hypothetical protein
MISGKKQGDADRQIGKNSLPKVDMAATRRSFMRSVGLTAASAAVLGGASTGAMAQSANVDVQILNFALNLDYLEAEFYLLAAFGRGLDAGDTTGLGTAGGVTGGRKVNFQDPLVADYANEIATDEETHVKFLRTVLGSAAVARPLIDLATSFTTAARAGNLISQTDTFDAFADDSSFLLAA